jgi:hypothetical protein
MASKPIYATKKVFRNRDILLLAPTVYREIENYLLQHGDGIANDSIHQIWVDQLSRESREWFVKQGCFVDELILVRFSW